MARLTQSEAREQTRRSLLDAARRVFGKRGFGGAALDDIAEEAGYTRGALYYNFPGGKEDLFLALLEDRIEARIEATESAFSNGGREDVASTLAQARDAAADAGAAVRENREWQLLFFEFALHAARDRRFARRMAASEGRLRAFLAALIEERAAALGGEPPIPAESLARALNALANGVMLDRLVEPGAVPEDFLEQIVGLLIAGAIAQGEEKARKR
jgi:AcrR family transcriptional regulator